jgi:DNA-binding NtrC family response regulator
MRKDILALVISDEAGPVAALETGLRPLLKTQRVRTCQEAKELMTAQRKPDIIFSDLSMPDGTWADVVKIIKSQHDSPEVIVVSRLPDTKLYMEVMERGGFDFITPPFAASDLAHVVKSATVDASKRWGAHTRAMANQA